MMKFMFVISILLIITMYLMFHYQSYEITKQIPAVCTGKWMENYDTNIMHFITGFRASNNQELEFNNPDCFLNKNVRTGDTYLLDVKICIRGNRTSYYVSNVHSLYS